MMKGVFYFQFGIMQRGAVWVRSAFALPSLCLRSGFARGDGRLAELSIPICGGYLYSCYARLAGES